MNLLNTTIVDEVIDGSKQDRRKKVLKTFPIFPHSLICFFFFFFQHNMAVVLYNLSESVTFCLLQHHYILYHWVSGPSNTEQLNTVNPLTL